jgi:5S rRNA maturation endonuclease (ribonuclease M5)
MSNERSRQKNLDNVIERLENYGIKIRNYNSLGQTYSTKCPWCNGHFSLNLERGLFICFSANCGRKGHISSLIGEYDTLDDFERNFAGGIGNKDDFDFDNCGDLLGYGDVVRSAEGIQAGDCVQTKVDGELKEFQFIHQYMLDRGFDREFLIRNKIGYDYKTYSVTIPIFEDDWLYDSHVSGQVYHGLIRRTILDWVQPRYLYPDKFKRVSTLFRPIWVTPEATSSPKSKRNIKKVLLIVEGSLDALKTAQNGFKSVSILGCYASWKQIKKIQKICEREGLLPIFLLDNDKAGNEGLEKILRENPHFNCNIAQIGDLWYAGNSNVENNNDGIVTSKKDPGELTEDELIWLVEHSQTRLDFELAQFTF